MSNVTAEQITSALAAKYAPPQFAFLPQCSSGTGANYQRTADAIAMSLWPSRGLDLIGFEIKVTRADWLRELKDPAKAEAVAKHCGYWLIVTPPGVVNDGELPRTWGLLEFSGNKLTTKVAAPHYESGDGINRSFVASILRNYTGGDAKALGHEYDRGFVAGTKHGSKSKDTSIEYERNQLRERIAKFKDSSGIDLMDGRYSWDMGNVGAAVRMVREFGIEKIRGIARQAKQGMTQFMAACDQMIEFKFDVDPREGKLAHVIREILACSAHFHGASPVPRCGNGNFCERHRNEIVKAMTPEQYLTPEEGQGKAA